MALKLGELVTYLKADSDHLERGLDTAERDLKDSGRDMGREAITIGAKIGDGLWVGADGRLRDMRGRFAKAGKDAGDDASKGFLSRFRGGIGGLKDIVADGFGGLPPQAKGAVVAAAAALGAVFVAGLASAILLGLGGGVIALGIKTAMEDPAVAAAWKGFGERAKKATAGFTDAFKGPVGRAARTFGDSIERMEPAFTRIGKAMAPVIDKLAPALASMAERAMPGIEKAIKQSGPLFEKFAEHLPKIGDAVSSFFDSISDSGPGALIFIDMVLTAFEGLIRFWGNGIEFWSNTLEVLNTFFTDKVPAAFQWTVDKISGGVSAITGFFSGAAGWITRRWNSLISFVGGLGGRIRARAAGMWDGIKSAFRNAINWIIAKWNNLSFSIPRVSIPGIGGIGGATLNTPNIPYLATGGRITESGLAVVHRGETVTPARAARLPSGGEPVTVRLTGELRARGSDLVLVLRDTIGGRGGNVQAVIGSNA